MDLEIWGFDGTQTHANDAIAGNAAHLDGIRTQRVVHGEICPPVGGRRVFDGQDNVAAGPLNDNRLPYGPDAMEVENLDKDAVLAC